MDQPWPWQHSLTHWFIHSLIHPTKIFKYLLCSAQCVADPIRITPWFLHSRGSAGCCGQIQEKPRLLSGQGMFIQEGEPETGAGERASISWCGKKCREASWWGKGKKTLGHKRLGPTGGAPTSGGQMAVPLPTGSEPQGGGRRGAQNKPSAHPWLLCCPLQLPPVFTWRKISQEGLKRGPLHKLIINRRKYRKRKDSSYVC